MCKAAVVGAGVPPLKPVKPVPKNLVGLCFSAGDHVKVNCIWRARCFLCKKPGHEARDCRLVLRRSNGKRGHSLSRRDTCRRATPHRRAMHRRAANDDDTACARLVSTVHSPSVPRCCEPPTPPPPPPPPKDPNMEVAADLNPGPGAPPAEGRLTEIVIILALRSLRQPRRISHVRWSRSLGERGPWSPRPWCGTISATTSASPWRPSPSIVTPSPCSGGLGGAHPWPRREPSLSECSSE